ncbi:MAG: hypothetical protein Q8L28_00385 [bacterium]|nr:hypothetical protein [bacterium]
MHPFSFLDPSFNIDYVMRILEDIENLVDIKNKKLDKDFREWESENEANKETNEEYYYAMEGNFIDESYFISELEANLLNGLSVTINTVFETHVRYFIREMSKMESSINYDDKHTYKMSELIVAMDTAKHPNMEKIGQPLLGRLRAYTNIRNCIVHHEGIVPRRDFARTFISDNRGLFNLDEPLWKISVKGDFIRKVIEDLKFFFRLLAYTSSGDVIFH